MGILLVYGDEKVSCGLADGFLHGGSGVAVGL